LSGTQNAWPELRVSHYSRFLPGSRGIDCCVVARSGPHDCRVGTSILTLPAGLANPSESDADAQAAAPPEPSPGENALSSANLTVTTANIAPFSGIFG
jgi:hypothetical protein